MKQYLSLDRLKESFASVIRRFPVASALIFLYTAYGVCCVWDAPTSREFDIAANVSLSLGILFSTASYLWCSALRASARTSAVCQTTGAVLSAVNFCYILLRGRYLGYTDAISYATAYTALATAIFFLPPIGSPSLARQWRYSMGVTGAVCFAIVLAVILGAFTGIVFGTLNILFGITGIRLSSTVWILLSGTVPALAALYRLPSGDDSDASEGVSGPALFTKNVLLPLALVYAAILYVYGLKILFTFDLPKGSVSMMVTGLVSAVLVIVYGLQGYLLESAGTERGRRIAAAASRWLPAAMLPLLVLMSVAIFYRINEYGVTPKRLYVATFNIWAYVVAIYLTVRREPALNIVAASFAGIFFLTSALPGFNYSTWGLNAVREKVKTELAEAGLDNMPVEYEALKAALAKLPRAKAESIAEDLSRLDEWDNHSAVADIVKSDETLYAWKLLSDNDVVTEEVPTAYTDAKGKVDGGALSPIPEGYASVAYYAPDVSIALTPERDETIEMMLVDSLSIRIPVDSLAALDPAAGFRAVKADVSGEAGAAFYITEYSLQAERMLGKPYCRISLGGYLFRKQTSNNDISK